MKPYYLSILLIFFFKILPAQNITYTYDKLNRLISVTYPDSSSIKYTYDATGNRSSLRIDNICFKKLPPTISANKSLIFCTGDSVVLTSSSAAQYLWSSGDTTQNLVIKKSGKFAVTAKYSSSCSKTSDSITVIVNSLPVVRISPLIDTLVLCSGDSAKLQSDTVNIRKYQWSTGDSSLFIFAKAIATITLKLTNNQGCSDSSSKVIKINPVPVAIAGTSLTICSGISVTIGAPAIAGNTYSWSPSSGLSDSSIASPIAKPLTTTKYVLKVTNPFGCISKDSLTITVKQSPVAKITPTTTLVFCTGESSVLKADTTNNYLYNYVYRWVNSSLSPVTVSSTASSIVVTQTGIYQLKLTSSNGCVDSTTKSVTVNPLPVAIAGTSLTICSGISVTIGAPAIAGNTYSWSPSSGLSDSSIASPIAKPLTTTKYVLKVTNPFGCISKDSLTITVKQSPVAKITPNITATICVGETAIFRADSLSGYKFQWSTGASNSFINAKDAGDYKVVVIAPNGCTDSTKGKLIVNPLPVYNLGPDKTICSGTSVVVGSPGSSQDSFTWFPATDLNNPNISAPLANPRITTLYNIQVTNIYNCTIVLSVNVFVKPSPIAKISLSADSAICLGDSVALIAATVASNSYLWSTGSLLSSIFVSQAGKYSLTVTSPNGCTDTTSKTITTKPLPDAVVGSDKNICYLDSVQIGSINNAVYQCRWTPSNGLVNSLSPNPFAKPLISTIYTLYALNSQGCSIQKSISVNVNSLPIVQAGKPIVINMGNSTNLGSTPTAAGNAPFVYSWFPNANSGTGLNTSNPLVSPSKTTNFTVRATDQNGCSDTSSVLVVVIPEAESFHGFLDPASGVVKVYGAHLLEGPYHISIMNTTGFTGVASRSVQVTNASLFYQTTINHLPAGTYLITIYNSSSPMSLKTIKILKM